MRTLPYTAILCMTAASACYGQVEAVRAGTAASDQLHANSADFQARIKAQQEQIKRAREVGQALFGVDERWSTEQGSKYAGTLARKNPPSYLIGDWGSTHAVFRVLNKVSDTECLALPIYKDSEAMLIRGLDMSKVTDGVEFVLQYPVVIDSTYSYTAVSGSTKTVLVLERNDAKVNEFAEKEAAKAEAERAAAEAALYRMWMDATGSFSISAKFLEFKAGQVHLERQDNHKVVQVPITRLSDEDQQWVRDELKKRREQEQQKKAVRRN